MEWSLFGKPLKPACPSTRDEHFHHRSSGIDLKFVVSRFVGGGFEKEFEDVVVPRSAISLFNVSVQVAVVHVGQKIEKLSIPRESGFRGGFGGARSLLQPGNDKPVDDLCRFPDLVITNAIDPGWYRGKSAFQRRCWLLVLGERCCE